MTQKAGSEPSKSSNKLSRAEVSVMGSISEKTARATADRKALSALTEIGTLHSYKTTGQMLGAHQSKHSLEPHEEGSNRTDMEGGLFHPVFQSTS